MPAYVIDSRVEPTTGRKTYRVWETAPDHTDDRCLGEYDSLASAKSAVVAFWRPPDGDGDHGHEAWGFLEDEPELSVDEDYPRGTT